MRLVIESTKTNAGTGKLPMTENVARCFRAIIEDREELKCKGWWTAMRNSCSQIRKATQKWPCIGNTASSTWSKGIMIFTEDIYRVEMPNVTPHICRHTYCSNMAKSGMNPKTLQCLMGHSDIGVTINTYMHLGLEDVTDELNRWKNWRMPERSLKRIRKRSPFHRKCSGQSE